MERRESPVGRPRRRRRRVKESRRRRQKTRRRVGRTGRLRLPASGVRRWMRRCAEHGRRRRRRGRAHHAHPGRRLLLVVVLLLRQVGRQRHWQCRRRPGRRCHGTAFQRRRTSYSAAAAIAAAAAAVKRLLLCNVGDINTLCGNNARHDELGRRVLRHLDYLDRRRPVVNVQQSSKRLVPQLNLLLFGRLVLTRGMLVARRAPGQLLLSLEHFVLREAPAAVARLFCIRWCHVAPPHSLHNLVPLGPLHVRAAGARAPHRAPCLRAGRRSRARFLFMWRKRAGSCFVNFVASKAPPEREERRETPAHVALKQKSAWPTCTAIAATMDRAQRMRRRRGDPSTLW